MAGEAAKLIQDGSTINVAVGTGTAITAGDVNYVGDGVLGVARESSPSGTASTISYAVSGVWELPAATGVAFSQGQRIAYDASGDTCIATGSAATGDAVAGVAWAAKTAGAANTTVYVKLGASVHTATS